MDPALKNLREWVLILALLFISFDLAGIEYGARLDASASSTPDLSTDRVAALVRSHRADRYFIYVTSKQRHIFIGLGCGAAGALLTLLGVIVVHGMRITDRRSRAEEAPHASRTPGGRRNIRPHTLAQLWRQHERPGRKRHGPSDRG